jgi:hypothetical protein
MKRHPNPKPCKNKEKCKFLKKNICEFSHDIHEKEISDIQGEAEMLIEIHNLKHLVSESKVENESKVKSLVEAIDLERKIIKEHACLQKEMLKKNDDLERVLSKEIKELTIKIVKLETSERDLELKVKNIQTELNREIKSCQAKIVCQQKVITEMLAKEKVLDTKVKVAIDKLEQEILVLKTKDVEDESNIVLKKLKGRNVTILPTKTVNQPVKTPALMDPVATVEEIQNVKNDSKFKEDSAVNVESVLNPKTRKLKKEDKENLITEDFEGDCKDIFTVKTNCGLELSEHKYKKCEYETHSLGLLWNHNKTVHKLKETFQNILIGFENNMRAHLYLLETMEDPTNNFKCDQCAFTTHSKGEFMNLKCIREDPPGANLDPSIGCYLCCSLTVFTLCIYCAYLWEINNK